MKQRHLYIGLISGTSMDGIDAALVNLQGQCEVMHTLFTSYSNNTRRVLDKVVNEADCCKLDLLGGLDQQIGEEFAAAANAVLQQSGLTTSDIAAIGSHGQTVRHLPDDGTQRQIPFTMQVGDPNVIAERSGITTIADFRRRDMAAGGQGAPMVPAFHAALLQERRPAAVINIGGIANITVVDSSGNVFGFDTGPGNCLMNQWVQTHLKQSYDEGGVLAAQGKAAPELLARLLDDPYFRQARPKSTGPEYFNLAWLQPHLAGLKLSHEDLLMSLNQLTAASIAQAVSEHAHHAETIYLCGGGVHNETLQTGLAELLPDQTISSTAALGIDPDFVEAAAFAWLAQQTLTGNPGNMPSVTGARKAVVLGGIYKG